jgi:cytochrome c-type biogenesis protein
VVQGAVLSFIFAMGMGLPLILLATFFSRMDHNSRFWQIMRGRGFAVRLGSWTLHLHTTSLISGLLLILMGWLLASGQLIAITQFAESSPLAQWLLTIEGWITQLFGI